MMHGLGTNTDGVLRGYLEDHLPVGFYTNPPPGCRAIFSTNDGKEPFQPVEHILPYLQIQLWAKDEIQATCNSVRKKYWAHIKEMVRPSCWDDLWTYFDARDLYRYGALNLWNVINHLYDENELIQKNMETEWAAEIGQWAEEWTRKEGNVLKLKEWSDTKGPIFYILSDEDLKDIGCIQDDMIPRISSALKCRRALLFADGFHKARTGPNDVLSASRNRNFENWLAAEPVYGNNGLPSPPASERHKCSPAASKQPAPYHVYKGRHYYLPEGFQQKPTAVEALHKSAAAAAVPAKTKHDASKSTRVVANGTARPTPDPVSDHSKGDGKYQKQSTTQQKQSKEVAKESRAGNGLENNVAPVAVLEKQVSPTPHARGHRVTANDNCQEEKADLSLQIMMAAPSQPIHVKRPSNSGLLNQVTTPDPNGIATVLHLGPNTASGQPVKEPGSAAVFDHPPIRAMHGEASPYIGQAYQQNMAYAHQPDESGTTKSQAWAHPSMSGHHPLLVRLPRQTTQTRISSGGGQQQAGAVDCQPSSTTHSASLVEISPPNSYDQQESMPRPASQEYSRPAVPNETRPDAPRGNQADVPPELVPPSFSGACSSFNTQREPRISGDVRNWTPAREQGQMGFEGKQHSSSTGDRQWNALRHLQGKESRDSQVQNNSNFHLESQTNEPFSQPRGPDGKPWRQPWRNAFPAHQYNGQWTNVDCKNRNRAEPHEYNPCECDKCSNKNRSIHVKVKSCPHADTKDIQARLKFGLASRFGKVDDVFPIIGKYGNTFIVRFQSEASVPEALKVSNGLLAEKELSIAIGFVHRSKWAPRMKTQTRSNNDFHTEHPQSMARPASYAPHFGITGPANIAGVHVPTHLCAYGQNATNLTPESHHGFASDVYIYPSAVSAHTPPFVQPHANDPRNTWQRDGNGHAGREFMGQISPAKNRKPSKNEAEGSRADRDSLSHAAPTLAVNKTCELQRTSTPPDEHSSKFQQRQIETMTTASMSGSNNVPVKENCVEKMEESRDPESNNGVHDKSPSGQQPVMKDSRVSSNFTAEEIEGRKQAWDRIPMPLDPRNLKRSPVKDGKLSPEHFQAKQPSKDFVEDRICREKTPSLKLDKQERSPSEGSRTMSLGSEPSNRSYRPQTAQSPATEPTKSPASRSSHRHSSSPQSSNASSHDMLPPRIARGEGHNYKTWNRTERAPRPTLAVLNVAVGDTRGDSQPGTTDGEPRGMRTAVTEVARPAEGLAMNKAKLRAKKQKKSKRANVLQPISHADASQREECTEAKHTVSSQGPPENERSTKKPPAQLVPVLLNPERPASYVGTIASAEGDRLDRQTVVKQEYHSQHAPAQGDLKSNPIEEDTKKLGSLPVSKKPNETAMPDPGSGVTADGSVDVREITPLGNGTLAAVQDSMSVPQEPSSTQREETLHEGLQGNSNGQGRKQDSPSAVDVARQTEHGTSNGENTLILAKKGDKEAVPPVRSSSRNAKQVSEGNKPTELNAQDWPSLPVSAGKGKGPEQQQNAKWRK